MSIQTFKSAVTGVGACEPIELRDANEIRVAYAVHVTGVVTYSVQHSLDGELWFDNDDNTGQVASADGNYSFPVRSIRVNVTSGTGTATLIVRQLVA